MEYSVYSAIAMSPTMITEMSKNSTSYLYMLMKYLIVGFCTHIHFSHLTIQYSYTCNKVIPLSQDKYKHFT